MQRDHLVGLGHQQLAGKGHARSLVSRVRHALHQIEIATVTVADHGRRLDGADQSDLCDLKAADRPRRKREPVEAERRGTSDLEGHRLVALLERRVQRVAIHLGPGFAVGGTFEQPRTRVAFGYVVAAGERVGADRLRLGKLHLPHHGRVAVVDAPLRAQVAVHRVLDRFAVAGRVSAGRRELRLGAVVEIDDQIAQRLVAAELVDVAPAADAVGVAKALAQNGAGTGDIASEQLLAYFRQALVRVVAVAVVRSARPERRLVQHDPLAAHSAEIHRAQPSVAQRAGFVERLGRADKPHTHRFRRRGDFRGPAEPCGDSKGGEQG